MEGESEFNAQIVAAAFPELDIDPHPLGEGGMKSAYRILETTPRVLKVIREPVPEDSIEGALSLPERIRREIETLKSIDHPGIVSVLDGPDVRHMGNKPRVWYIEPYYASGTLADRLSVPLVESECIQLLSSLVKAAEALADHNVVHRDIKPSNIVFDNNGAPVLLDLGIAYFQDLTPLTENWDQSPKTPAYSAPEQYALRMQSVIDFRTDLFLIGLVVFEALTGTHPFNPSDPAGYHQRLLNGEWDEDALDRVDVSPGMRHLLRRLLAPSMSRRFRKFEHVHSRIEECI